MILHLVFVVLLVLWPLVGIFYAVQLFRVYPRIRFDLRDMRHILAAVGMTLGWPILLILSPLFHDER